MNSNERGRRSSYKLDSEESDEELFDLGYQEIFRENLVHLEDMKTKGEGSNSRRSEIEDQALEWERKQDQEGVHQTYKISVYVLFELSNCLDGIVHASMIYGSTH